jgi:hypothetical protein
VVVRVEPNRIGEQQMTSALEIKEWFDRAKAEGARYMIVVCDTFSHDDYPVFCKDADDAKAQYKHYTTRRPSPIDRALSIVGSADSATAIILAKLPRSTRLTVPQLKELLHLENGIQSTSGGGHRRSRVLNSLRSKKLARMFNTDGHVPDVLEIVTTSNYRPLYDRCEITELGRQALMQDPRATAYRKQAGNLLRKAAK